MKTPVSVVILCINEESNILECLESCRWCDDVHLLDSGSSDATVQIARDWGAQIHFHPFESFGKQRNWAIENIETKYPWQFHLDADERFTKQLEKECGKIVNDEIKNQFAAFLVADKLYFMGRWLKNSADFPRYQVRFFHRERCRFQDHGHGQRELTDGQIGQLDAPLIHLNFSKGLDDWFAKHNRYSTLEARLTAEVMQGKAVTPRELLKGDRLERRRALKNFSYRLPARPLLRFVHLFVLKKGFLDGKPGFYYCVLMTIYEIMIELKRRELAWQNSEAKRGISQRGAD